jgi:hypothetical protein
MESLKDTRNLGLLDVVAVFLVLLLEAVPEVVTGLAIAGDAVTTRS